MNFESWTVKRTDTLRVRRLMVGSVVGAITVVASLAFIVLSSKGAGAAVEEEEGPIEVSLAKEPEPAEPPPPPPPTEKPKQQAPRPRLASPLAVPDDKPAEKEPAPQQVVEEEEEKPAEPAIASAAPPPPPPPVVKAKPTIKKPVRLTEDMPKPVQIVMKKPDYPADAKSAGIEGVVVVKFVIAEDGSVRDAKVLKGPPELQAVCLEAVRAWRYQPVLIDGVPTAVVKIARFPFRIR
jgi:periplasmic protein TonB